MQILETGTLFTIECRKHVENETFNYFRKCIRNKIGIGSGLRQQKSEKVSGTKKK